MAPPTPTPPRDNDPKRRLLAVLASDVPSSVVVFLVAVPLSMGIALASGAPIMAGLISAAVGGLVVGALAGAPLQVSGPAAGLAVILFGLIEQFGFPAVCALTLAAGVLQVLLGVFRVARVTMAISPAVIHGMLAGIGILIALSQLHIVLGGTPQSSALRNLAELPGQVAGLHGPATLLGLLTIAILIAWPLLPWRRLRVVPGALVAVVTASAVSVAFGMDVARVQLPAGLLEAFHLPVMPSGSWTAIIGGAVALTMVASAESLLCAVATDKLHSGPRANLDRELIAQGMGNAVAGLIGGVPITGVIVRSTANIEAGGKTRLSAMLHGAWVIVFVTQLGDLIARIPLSVLAGLLVFVGVKLVNVAHIRELLRHREGLVYFVTLAGIVGINLLAGIGLGIATAVIALLLRLGKVDIRLDQRGTRWHLTVRGALTFLGVPKLSTYLGRIPPGAHVDVDLDVKIIDHAGFEALHAWRLSHERSGGQVDIDQLHEVWRERPAEAAPTVKSDGKDAIGDLVC